MEKFIAKFKEILPIVFEQDIVSESELIELLNWYQEDLKGRVDSTRPIYFMDRFVAAVGGNDKQSQAFLCLYQKSLSDLLDAYNGIFDTSIIYKIRNSILGKVKHPSFMDAIGELLLISYLVKHSKKDGYEYLGIGFKLGNGKDADIAFRKDNAIQLVEIKSVHYLKDKNLVEELRRQVENKLTKKAVNEKEVREYFKNEYPNVAVTLTIALFVWEETFNIKGSKDDLDKLVSEKKDDMFPPQTLLCQKDMNGNYHWDIISLSNALERWDEIKTSESFT